MDDAKDPKAPGRMTKKEATKTPPLLYMFEQIMDGRGLFMDATDWRELQCSCHVKWLIPLVKLGAIRETGSHPAWPEGMKHRGRPQFTYHDFKVTPEGMSWWARERVADDDKRCGSPISLELLVQPRADGSTPVPSGKGIGGVIHFWWEPEIRAAVKGIRDGYFELLHHDNGHPGFWRMNESITVSLTKAGMEYFDSIPKLELLCA